MSGDAAELRLSPRQRDLYNSYESVAERYGKFDTSPGPDGAHYAPAAANPFKPDLVCANCAFYEDDGSCEIVTGPLAGGKVEPQAVCKLWIIPAAPDPSQQQYELGTMIRDAIARNING